MKILIVEDELKTGNYLHKGLSEAGFIVDLYNNGEDGLFYGKTLEYDLAILDIMLPKVDGWEILQELRKAKKEFPVLFLTARDHLDDRVKGLELGADDYLIKPFAFAELLARVRSLLRRCSNTQILSFIDIADLKVDLLKRRASRAGKPLDLTAKEFSLLELFLLRRGEILSRSLIASQIWEMNFDSDSNVIEVAIRRLRAKIDDDHNVKLLHTVRGMGYILENRQE